MILCRPCHDIVEGAIKRGKCPACGQKFEGARKHRLRCAVIRGERMATIREWAHGEALKEQEARNGK